MLSLFLPSWILIFITTPLFVFVTVIVSSLIFILGIVKLLLPLKPITKVLNFVINMIWRSWAIGNLLVMNLTNNIDWQIDFSAKVDSKSWYLLICNHLSWLDIMVLTQLSLHRLPPPKFFLKNELKRVPFIGMAAWAMDMPFMKRFSRSYLAKHPEMKGKDIESTQKSCEKFQNIPTTIINFVEGTRFTEEKKAHQNSDFHRLLNPRAGGIAFTLSAMGHLFSGVLNVTLNYPDNRLPLKDIMLGRMKRIHVNVELLDVNDDMIGDYFNDEEFKSRFQTWLNNLWSKKDKLLTQLNKE